MKNHLILYTILCIYLNTKHLLYESSQKKENLVFLNLKEVAVI